VLTFLEGETVANRKPRPAWVHADDTLDQVARWMRAYRQAVADFVPPPGAVWRGGGTWSPRLQGVADALDRAIAELASFPR
jgi:hypothetical protein